MASTKQRSFMTLGEGEQCRYMGFLALDGHQFDRAPAAIDLAPEAPVHYDRHTDSATLPEARLFNCQELFFALRDPRGMQLGLYLTDQPELSSEIPWPGWIIPRLLRATRRTPDIVRQGNYAPAERAERFPKQPEMT
jgi:hypothetical protein